MPVCSRHILCSSWIMMLAIWFAVALKSANCQPTSCYGPSHKNTDGQHSTHPKMPVLCVQGQRSGGSLRKRRPARWAFVSRFPWPSCCQGREDGSEGERCDFTDASGETVIEVEYRFFQTFPLLPSSLFLCSHQVKCSKTNILQYIAISCTETVHADKHQQLLGSR